MMGTRTSSRIIAVMTAAAAALSGCGLGSGADDGETITLTVATFGDFGYDDLFAEYEREHPNIRLRSRITDFEAHHRSLATQLSVGTGAADIFAVEEGYLPQFRQSFDKFVNLADHGAGKLEDLYVPWKWEQSLADDGRVILGFGTDMGSLAMCYRKDMFEEAGLPAGRAEVAELWPTWEDYAEIAKEFSDAMPDTKFTASSGAVYTAMLNQSEEGYFARDESFIGNSNDAVKRAFDTAAAIGAKGQTAQVQPFTQEWSVAIKQGTFATMPCPAWMLALIREAGGEENAGKWDITSVPGGGGNQGGSFLTIPAQTAHPQEAYAVAKWLAEPEQQKRVFLETGNLPSQPSVYNDPEVLEKTDPYFNDAPVGQIFAASADSLEPNYRGLQDAVVRPIFGTALDRSETGMQPPEDAFAQAVAEARAAVNK